ncbi:hypothetical protein [Pontibacter russatus]|uniref:hypothetical protein n=1 Tax=Pontibacter russatus TaxID=2694929 RepID=UPI00137AD152|nr:hypothetical protein [Pontibacter russatus]
MAAGGHRPLSRGGSDKININVTGRNFDTPTQFNMAHKYRTAKDFIKAYLIKELPPLATIAGHFRLNGSAVFTPFTTIERGTIINEVRLTATLKSQVNSPGLKQLVITGSYQFAPQTIDFELGTRDSGIIERYDTRIGSSSSIKTYTAKGYDVKDVLSASSPSVAWGVGVKAYYGKGTATGAAITEAWVRENLLKHTVWNAHMGAVTVTPGAEDYIYYLAPVSWGLRVFEFLGSDQTNPESALRIKVRTDNEMLNGVEQSFATEYFVVRSLGKGLGGGAPYTFNIGTIG